MATHEGSPCRPVTIFCLHKFPQDHKTKAWLNQVRGVDMPPLENSYVCSEHFSSNENGGKVTLRGVRQAKTGGKMFVQCYKFGGLERQFSLPQEKWPINTQVGVHFLHFYYRQNDNKLYGLY